MFKCAQSSKKKVQAQEGKFKNHRLLGETQNENKNLLREKALGYK